MKLSPPPFPTTRRGCTELPAGPLGWELAIAGDLTDKQKDLIEALVQVPPRSRGVLYFDSCGGSVYAGLALATVIRLRGLDATGVVVGECSSAAVLPFAACTRRLVTPHATFFFHPIHWTGKEDLRAEEAVEWTRYMQTLEIDIDQLTARFFGAGGDKLAGWIRAGRFLSGAELAEAGLAELLDLFAGDLREQLAAKAPR